MPSILVFGATGFIGAPLCRALKKAHPGWTVSAHVRRNGALSEQQLATRVGTVDKIVEVSDWSDFEAIKRSSAQHDIVINAGNSFTADPVTAIIDGLQDRKKEGKMAKLIHISGGGNFIDFGTSGNFNPESKVWNDDSVDDIKQIHKDMFNGQSDTLVLEAGASGGLDTCIVCPSVVYGGAAVDAPGLGVGYNLIIGNAKPLGYVPYVGEGTALLSTVHVVDVVNFLVTITELAAASSSAKGTAYERYYIIETARVAWKDLATRLADALHREDPKTFPSSEPKQVAFEEAGQGEVKHLVAANMLVEGPRARRAGYQPNGQHILTQLAADLKGMVA
ncbi:hypothetical protein F4808DRAFT_473087 [Astrocystis sublimbata]|nr:hypothetical protein F4808DRAFT_473087 [Astrocystis sublimbata]